MKTKICVIGAGAAGLTSLKNCIQAGFDVVCYEQSNFVGGLWKYRDGDVEGYASVAKSTIINSSKEMSAYSDFPPPHEFANYMHNTQMHKYFEMYAEHFDLQRHIKFYRKVLKCDKTENYQQTGQWKVTTEDTRTKKIFTDIFDGVLVCVGHHVKPHFPHFIGQENFKGNLLHSHSYKKPSPFEDQTAVVVGIGNSAGDIAVELSSVAKKVYHSFRRGSWLIWRVGTHGWPADGEFLRKFFFDIINLLPERWVDWYFETILSNRVDHRLYGLEPDHRFSSQHPLINDALPNRILSGTVVPKSVIKEFTEDGVIFDGEEEVTKCDTVVFATGYEYSIPFLDKSIWCKDGAPFLYKHMISPQLTPQAHTLGIIGAFQAIGPGIPGFELQTFYYIRLMKGNHLTSHRLSANHFFVGDVKLPSQGDMIKEIEEKRNIHDKRYYRSNRHINQIDFVPYLEELSHVTGVRPNYLKIFFTDPKLWYKLVFGPYTPYRFRLDGPFYWEKARQTIMETEQRILAPFTTRKPDSVLKSTS